MSRVRGPKLLRATTLRKVTLLLSSGTNDSQVVPELHYAPLNVVKIVETPYMLFTDKRVYWRDPLSQIIGVKVPFFGSETLLFLARYGVRIKTKVRGLNRPCEILDFRTYLRQWDRPYYFVSLYCYLIISRLLLVFGGLVGFFTTRVPSSLIQDSGYKGETDGQNKNNRFFRNFIRY